MPAELFRTPITNPSKLLLKYKFWNDKGKEELGELEDQELDQKIRELEIEKAESFADEHHIDISAEQMWRTGYPKPFSSYRLIYETFQKPVEAYYFWSLNHLKDLGFPEVEKIIDVFSASEQSSFYGAAKTRLSLSEDRVQQFLANIGRFIKDLFSMTREIRIIKERLQLYEGATSDKKDIREPAEIALKGLWVDLVEGGAKNPGSVFGLASQIGYTSLPDLFFMTHPKTLEEVNEMVDELEFNDQLKWVLKRKLAQFINWKKATEVELKQREQHSLKYLRQHYNMIQMYMEWLKPYLHHVKRLNMDKERIDSADLVGAFEGSIVEVEILGKQMPKGNKKTYACILYNMTYRTAPQMSFSREGRHQGPIHVGRVECTWRSYAWTQEDIERYKSMREMEAFQLLGEIDQSIRESMAGVSESLHEYLKEAGEIVHEVPEKKEEKKKKEIKYPSLLEEFGLKDAYEDLKNLFKPKPKDKEKEKAKEEADAAKKAATIAAWIHYENFKKANQLLTW